MSRKILTTIGPNSWELYGRRFVESFKANWPADIELEIWHHHLGDNIPSYPGVTFRCLDETEAFKKLVAALGPDAKDGPTLSYCFKAVALANAVTPDLDWIGFVDADTETMRPVTPALLDTLFDNSYDLTYLYRKSVRESEGSWFAFNLRSVTGASLLADYYGLYTSLEAFHYKKSHDNAVLDRLVTIHQAHGLKVKNLSEGALGLDAFHQSMLGAYLIHYKGPNKDIIADPALAQPSRYEMLCEMLTQSIEATGRANIVEVGTWNGTRAVQMALAAFNAGQKTVSYVGFDTFDDGNDRVHEGHSKPHASEEIVRARLQNFATYAARKGLTFTFSLIKGNTLQTLPATSAVLTDATFAYIDGGHSYETVSSDYENLKHIPFIVFDDIIAEAEPNAPVGPREVFNSIEGQKRLNISPDPYAGCTGTIGLGLVVAEPYKMPQLRQRITVKPVDSVDKSEQFQHIATNSAAIRRWLEPYQAHDKVALFVSAGPTLRNYLGDIKKLQKKGAVIFAVKHAFPTLKAAGITPDFTVVLDPRPIDGLSTHGIVRTSLFEKATGRDTILMATMTHPSVREELERKGARILGWHAHTQATERANLPEFQTGLVVGGGTCAATRLPMLAYTMGFRRFKFYGYDFYYPQGTDQADIKQPLMTVNLGTNARSFLTTGELIAAMQDLNNWTKWLMDNRLSVEFYGDGAGAVIWEQAAAANNYHSLPEYPF